MTHGDSRGNRGRVAVVGQGYVGLPLAMRAVDVGFDVVGFDLDKARIGALLDGESYVDDVVDETVHHALQSGRYRPTDHEDTLAGFDYAIITVPTPLRDGVPDISFIEHAATSVGRHLSMGATVVLESTTFPGTTEQVVRPILEHESGLTAGREFFLGYSPERIDPGNETWTFVNTPKVVSGIDDASLHRVTELYSRLVDRTVPTKGTKEAELAKLLENTFRHVNIALVNELAMHAQSLGIDIWDVLQAADSKPFGYMTFKPGPGVGGHCLPVDPSYMSWSFERQLGTVSRFVKIADDVNRRMPDYVADRVQAGLNGLFKPVNGSRILVLGLAYKSNSNDARETPATPLIRTLLSRGAEIAAFDQYVDGYELDDAITRLRELTADEVAAADAVILLTAHSDVDYQLVVDNGAYVFDARRFLGDRPNVEAL